MIAETAEIVGSLNAVEAENNRPESEEPRL